jgi:hypothetical protein
MTVHALPLHTRLPAVECHTYYACGVRPKNLLVRPGNSVASIAELLGVSRSAIYKYVSELKSGRVALAEATAAVELPQPARPAE